MMKKFRLLVLVALALVLCTESAMAWNILLKCYECGDYVRFDCVDVGDGTHHLVCRNNKNHTTSMPSKYHTSHLFNTTVETLTTATCAAAGTIKVACGYNCGATTVMDNPNDPIKDHEYTVELSSTNPTCINPGTKTMKCKYCELTTTVTGDAATGVHSWGDYETYEAPTCTQNGTLIAHCNGDANCTATDIKDDPKNPALGHDWNEYTSNNDATCAVDGTKTRTCQRENCGIDDTVQDEGSALGHDWVVTYEWSEDYKSCTVSRICSRGDTDRQTATTEDITVKTIEATWTEEGAKIYTASFADTDAAEWVENATYKVSTGKKTSHWYGEWSPIADGTHTADCNHCGEAAIIDCETFEYAFTDENNEVSTFSLCPVCGEMSDGTRLEIVEDIEADGENLPEGEVIVRSNGEFMSVGFEFYGSLTQPTEEVTITLPAEIVDDYTLTILAADGTETALETTTDGETVSFTLNFGETPVVLIHMVVAA